MKLSPIIILSPIFCWASLAYAQMPEANSSSMPPWQDTVEMIKSKAQTLMVQNTGLQDETRQLNEQEKELEKMINDKQSKNQQMQHFLQDRHGRSDQQLHMDQLNQTIREKRKKAEALDSQWQNLQRKKTELDRKIEGYKYSISAMELHQQQAPKPIVIPAVTGDDGVSQWRKQLEDANSQEAILNNELESLKTGGKSQNVNVDTIDQQNKHLESRLDILRLQKMRHLQKPIETPTGRANAQRYNQLKKRKEMLEANISAYESRLDSLRDSSLLTLSWPLKKKTLIHEMVQRDARNNQLRGKIKDLREDINLLRDQVAHL